MNVFTTNWYLYKTYISPNLVQTQNKVTTTSTTSHKLKNCFSPNTNVVKKTADFEELLLESIDEGLSLLGESAKQVVYFHLEKTFKINKQDVPYRIEKFIDAIDRIFGSGAKILEIQIMKSLFKKVGCKIKNYPELNNLDFTEYVEAVKTSRDVWKQP